MPLLMLPYLLSTAWPLKQGFSNILTALFSILFYNGERRSLMTSSVKPRVASAWKLKTPNCVRRGWPVPQVWHLAFLWAPFSPQDVLRSYAVSLRAPAKIQLLLQLIAPKGVPWPSHRGGLSIWPSGWMVRVHPGKPRAWLAFRKFRAVYSSCASSSTTNSLTEWQQLYWQANSIKAPTSNKVSGSPPCIENMESCLHFPECPQP